jgi:hypothetical protein
MSHNPHKKDRLASHKNIIDQKYDLLFTINIDVKGRADINK